MAWALTSYVQTGALLHEGLRYQVPMLGLLAVAVGLGADHLARLLDRLPAAPWPGTLIAALALASPLVTHAAVYRDVIHNPQNEYRFLSAELRALPDGATVLLPDHLVRYDRRGDEWRTTEVAKLFRARDLLYGLAYLNRQALEVESLGAWLARAPAPPAAASAGWRPGPAGPGPVFFYQGLDCYRVQRPNSFAPVCRAVHEAAGGAPPSARFPNRAVTAVLAETIGIRVETVELALIPLPPEAQARLRSDGRLRAGGGP